MAENHSEKDLIKNGRTALIIATLSALVGGTGGPLLAVKLGFSDALRPDPFTGTEGRVIERRLESLEFHVRNHPDVALRLDIAELKEEAAAARKERELIIRNQDRILNRLDRSHAK